MAGYRQFHTKFWKDEWLIELEPIERYLFSYLFTNDLSSISGIYKIPKRVIKNETGLEMDFINAAFDKFQAAQKIMYADGVLWVVNMAKYHSNASPTTQQKVSNDIAYIPDCAVKRAYLYYLETGIYPTDTVSIQYGYDSLKAKAKEKAEEDVTSTAAANSPYIRAYKTILELTSWTAIPVGNDEQISIMQSICNKHGDKTLYYCRPYYDEYRKRYPRSNRLGWVDWAATGQIPEGKQQPTRGGMKRLEV